MATPQSKARGGRPGAKANGKRKSKQSRRVPQTSGPRSAASDGRLLVRYGKVPLHDDDERAWLDW